MGLAEYFFGDQEVPEEERKRLRKLEKLVNKLTKNGPQYYRLVNGKPIKCSFLEGVISFSQDDRRIDLTELDDCNVSTVFLGSAHKVIGSDEPVLFETLIRGGDWDGHTYRYRTHGEAKRGHWQIVDCLREGRPPEVDCGGRGIFDFFLEMLREQNGEDEEGEDEEGEDEWRKSYEPSSP